MFRYISVAFMLLSVPGIVYACDVCGASAGNQSLGLLPKPQYHFVGIQYQYNSFRSNHPAIFTSLPDEKSSNYYHTLQLWGRYSLYKKLQLFAFMPYRYNMQNYQDSIRLNNSGIGDISFLANYLFINRSDENAIQHQLLVGMGVKLPTGNYAGISSADKNGIPNMQPGTGSWDFIINANYTLTKQRLGLNLDAAYTVTTANKDDYKYGNRLSAGLLGFVKLQKAKMSFMPQAGLRYEFALHDYDQYSRKWLNEQTGGQLLYAVVGAQTYYSKLGLRMLYSRPIVQNYGAGNIKAGNKIEAGIFLLF